MPEIPSHFDSIRKLSDNVKVQQVLFYLSRGETKDFTLRDVTKNLNVTFPGYVSPSWVKVKRVLIRWLTISKIWKQTNLFW